MANIKLGAIISDIKGSIGGSTFQRSQGGLTLKGKSTQSKTSTMNQQFIQANIARLTQVWKTLSFADQQSWGAAAQFYGVKQKYNTDKSLSGFQYFLWYNQKQALSPSAYASTAQIANLPLRLVGFEVHLTAGVLRLTNPYAYTWDNNAHVLKFSFPYSYNKGVSRPNLRSVYIPATIGAALPFATQYQTAWGRLPNVGEYIYVELIEVLNTNTYWYSVASGWFEVL